MATPDDIDPVVLKEARNAVVQARGNLARLNNHAIDLLFREARTHHTWLDKPVSEDDLRTLYDVFKWGPTSTNGNPARITFVRSDAEREKVKACVAEGNVGKVATAPVIAIVAYDTSFWERLPELFAHRDMSERYIGKPEYAETTAFRNSSLQGAYLMLAARALGFDSGAISGFDNAALDKAFFAGTTLKSNFICNIGYGDVSGLFPRLPRLEFDEACRIV